MCHAMRTPCAGMANQRIRHVADLSKLNKTIRFSRGEWREAVGAARKETERRGERVYASELIRRGGLALVRQINAAEPSTVGL